MDTIPILEPVKCDTCGKTKPRYEFSFPKHKRSKEKCKDCITAKNKEYRHKRLGKNTGFDWLSVQGKKMRGN